MKLAVFGGTGRTGSLFIEQALAAGHSVTALARTPAKLTLTHPALTLIAGSLDDPAAIARVIEGADAVVSALGPTHNKPDYAISRGTDHILAAMQKYGVRRLIFTTGAGVRDPLDKPKFVDRFFGALLNIVARHVVADMRQAVAKIRAADLDWTVVRAPMLTDQPARGSLKVGYVGDITPRLARADMATFMLDQLHETAWLRQAPAISN